MLEKKKILKEISKIAKEIFNRHKSEISENTSANDVEQWDSLANIHFLLIIEQKFNVKFSTLEISSFNNIGDIIKMITTKSDKS